MNKITNLKKKNTDALGGLEFEETGSFEMINAADSAANGGTSGLPDFGAPAELDADGYPSNNEGNLTTPPSFPSLPQESSFPISKTVRHIIFPLKFYLG